MADRPESGTDRLTSWKEIAAYLGRGVRTAERWEQELGLPVHRLEGKKRDIVHALPEELDAWLEEHSHQLDRNNADPTAPTPSPAAPAAGRSQSPTPRQEPGGSARVGAELPWLRVWVVRGAVTALVLALLWGGWRSWSWLTATPADYRVEGHNLIVLDKSGRELWRHTFDFPLSENEYKMARSPGFGPPGRHLAALRDFNGDGHRELLFGVAPAEGLYEERALLCFDHQGRILWRYQPTRTVHYGDHRAPGDHHFKPPYSFGGFYFFSKGEGAPDAIWVTFLRAPWFPAVIAKLNAEGELLGEYWHAGNVGVLAEATIAGRHVILAGAVNNEHISPSISVLDYENPTGFSPAANPAYLCQNCPSGSPLAYLRLPRSELGRTLEAYETIRYIRLFGDDTLQIATRITTQNTAYLDLTTYYFDQDLRLVDVTIGSSYAALHNKLKMEGMLDHELDWEKELAELGIPLYWNGQEFTPKWAGLNRQRTSASSEPPRLAGQ